MLTIFTPQITNRIRHTFDLFFIDLLGLEFQLTQNKDQFLTAAEPKISYGREPVKDELCFSAMFILFEKGIKEQKLEVTEYEGVKCIFKLDDDQQHCLPFDPFAAGFFLTSRYEEYLPHEKDQYGRFPAERSFAFKNKFLQIPVVNYYAEMVKKKLLERYPQLEFQRKKFQFIPTYDIDSAYAFLNKGIVRNFGGLMQSLVNLDFETLRERLLVLAKLRNDPFDTYGWLDEIHDRYKLQPIFFFLVGDYDEYDKNISLNILEFRQLIKSISDSADVGIHPSYASVDDPKKMKREIDRLAQVLKREIKKSRQHFLRLQIPVSYQRLAEYDITDDYTMGFAKHPGFRASICSSFSFYDLERENKTNIRIHPFAVMDATLYYYQRLTPQQVPEVVNPIIDEIKKVNGTFISLWHNNSLSEEKEWTGWKIVYENLIKYTLDLE